ncbi:hypothetical protein [Microbacterium sp. CGR1]|uniref:hypothetical protein n=1 Tax=Microbacterium sp. CGR1 TaxID=1696072 RepID=UPI003DA2FB71
MTSDSDDALSWDGDEGGSPTRPAPKKPAKASRERAESAQTQGEANDPALPEGWNAVGKGSAAVGRIENEDDEDQQPLSTAMLLILGIVGGVYLLYSVGWVVGGLRLKPLANFFVADAMFLPWFVLAVAAPLLWFLASWVLTRGKAGWIRVSALLLGVVLLVPWPFVTVGAIGL